MSHHLVWVFVEELNDFLIESNCKCDIKSAKSGYLVSYILKDNKRTLASFVIRKSGVKIRIFWTFSMLKWIFYYPFLI